MNKFSISITDFHSSLQTKARIHMQKEQTMYEHRTISKTRTDILVSNVSR